MDQKHPPLTPAGLSGTTLHYAAPIGAVRLRRKSRLVAPAANRASDKDRGSRHGLPPSPKSTPDLASPTAGGPRRLLLLASGLLRKYYRLERPPLPPPPRRPLRTDGRPLTVGQTIGFQWSAMFIAAELPAPTARPPDRTP